MTMLIAAAAVFFVAPNGDDANPGTQEKPFRTVQKGADVASPGSQVMVREGVYHEKIVLNAEGTANDGPVVLASYNNEKAVISGEGVPKRNGAVSDDLIYGENKSFIVIKGLELRDLNTPEGSAIRFIGSGSHIEILNCKIHEIRGGGEKGGAMGITIYGSNNATPITNLVIDGNEIYDCDPADSEALTLNGNVSHFKVTNNTVHDVNNIGIDFIGGETWLSTQVARDGECRGNKVYRARHKDGYAAGIYVDGGARIIIENNEVYECDLGIEVGAENPNAVALGVTVGNNNIHDNNMPGLVFGGYKETAGRVNQCSFTGNTLKNNDLKDTGHGEIWAQWGTGNSVNQNRITPSVKGRMLYTEIGSINNTFDFDVFCPVNGIDKALFVWQGKEYQGLQAFQQASGQEKNATLCQ